MNIDTNRMPTKFLWVDLEMTGLDAQYDVLLEVCAKVADVSFTVLETYEAKFAQDPALVAERMAANPWWQDHAQNRTAFMASITQGRDGAAIEQDLIALVDRHYQDELPILAGNSIHNDRSFIKRWLPAFDSRLHYRMLDVSSFKVLMQGMFGLQYEKSESHRAADDIQESMEELAYYVQYLQHNGQPAPQAPKAPNAYAA